MYCVVCPLPSRAEYRTPSSRDLGDLLHTAAATPGSSQKSSAFPRESSALALPSAGRARRPYNYQHYSGQTTAHTMVNYDKQSSQHTTTAKATTSTGEGRPGRHASFCSVCSHHLSSHQQQGAAGFVQGLSFDEQRHDGQARRREVAERAEGRQGDALHARGDNKGVYLLCGGKGHPPRNTTSVKNKNKNKTGEQESDPSHRTRRMFLTEPSHRELAVRRFASGSLHIRRGLCPQRDVKENAERFRTERRELSARRTGAISTRACLLLTPL